MSLDDEGEDTDATTMDKIKNTKNTYHVTDRQSFLNDFFFRLFFDILFIL